MRSKLATFIISTIMFLIICVFILFGIVFWNQYVQLQTSTQTESVGTIVPEPQEPEENQNTIDKDIKVPEIIEENPFEGIKDTNVYTSQTEEPEQPSNIDYTNITINKYFYNQLDEYSKTIYKAFETNKENMKCGNYKIELGNTFSSLLKQENGSDELGKYYQSAIEAYTYDNPDVFYLSPNKMYLNVETTTTKNNVSYNVYINSGNEANYFIDEFSTKNNIDNAIFKIEQVRDEILSKRTNNTYKDIKMVHDYLINNIEYDTSISKNNIYNIYGAMVNKECVCEGYARSFKYLMDAINIPCTLVIGKATNSEGRTENHAWNYVSYNGSWYAVDCTWDDPVSTTGWVSQESKTKYFLKGTDTMSKDHFPSRQFTEGGKIFEYPNLSSTGV